LAVNLVRPARDRPAPGVAGLDVMGVRVGDGVSVTGPSVAGVRSRAPGAGKCRTAGL